MPEAGLHFAAPWWLLALAMPALVYLWLRLTAPKQDTRRYEAYADRHLLPHLLGDFLAPDQRPSRGALLRWSGLWVLGVLAMAGPRWDYQDMQLFRPGSDLVVLLDLSRSMDVKDVAPSRLGRARQELEDLIRRNHQARVGLIAFATVPHVVSPLTEDGAALLAQLPALSTDLVQMQGSRLPEALAQAQLMLVGQPPESSRHLLLISDGDFGDDDASQMVRELAAEGLHLHVLAVGTADGGDVPAGNGQPLRMPDGRPVHSSLDAARLKRLAELGGGLYREAEFHTDDSDDILRAVARQASAELVADQKTRVWNERFYLPLLLLMLLLLTRFRRGRREVSG